MDVFQQGDILRLVKDHFSKATDSDGLIVWDDVKGYGFEDAKRAIEDHRREKGAMAYRPDPRRIRSLAATYCNERRKKGGTVRTIDYLRQNDRAGLLHEYGDVAAIITHFRSAWDGVKVQPDGIGKNVARSFILAGATAAFREVGHQGAEAEQDARDIVDLGPGEKIPRKPLFGEPPPSLEKVKSYDALKNLAKAELAGGGAS